MGNAAGVPYHPYTYSGRPLIITFGRAEVTGPGFCEISYKCEVLEPSPRTDLCNVSTIGGEALFDQESLSYSLQVVDAIKFPPGTYTYRITASIGNHAGVSDSITF